MQTTTSSPYGGQSDGIYQKHTGPAVPSDPAALPLEMHPIDEPASVHSNIHAKLFTAAPFLFKKLTIKSHLVKSLMINSQ